MFDLISIGDAAVDYFFKISDAHLENGGTKLCFNFGDKLPVDEHQQTLGGNTPNSAVAAVKLGLKSAVYLNIGTDLAGKFTLTKLQEAGIDTRYVMENEEKNSNASAIISFNGERTILVFRQDFNYQLPDLDKTRWVHLSSMGKSAFDCNLNKQVENYLERVGASLVYNPGPYELSHGVKKFPRLLSLTNLLIVNKEEAEMILGGKPSIKKMLSGLVELGPKTVIITDGKEGSYSFDGEKVLKLGVFPAKVIDMTGAGDSFAAGVLAGLFYGKSLGEAMRWGAVDAASNIEEVGAQNGLLNYEKMQEKLKEHATITPKELK
ncbi:carbohydrate kinase family protein [Candidatus Daviesbacteria bacterium]|nr:carbohydrate kinase family protein [Candidatus Daviesbacteria bacterium]